QLVEFVGSMRDQQTLRRLADYVRQNEKELPVLFSAVVLSHDAGGIAEYLVNFSESGMKDIRGALRFGTGGLNELLKRNQRLYISSLQRRLAEYPGFAGVIDLASEYCWLTPWIALTIKWLLYLLSGFLLAMAMHFARPAVQAMERPLQVGGFHVAREFLFALGFLVAILLLTEPFLAQQGQRTEFMFRVRLPGISSTPAAGTGSGQQTKRILMEKSLVPLGLFFVLQGLLYVGCLVKLAEIRRQRVPAKIKLRLLDNEDHLFDAGLYLGFVGTIISLILFSLNIVTPSLMAAYSSTSFGIIFVSIFKIFNLRPARRRILLEAEANETANAPVRQFTPA
ncbi:MAG TPA: hypothetical protein VLT36_26075, partial [Candidatus Dormibacteraeota bacterium]|nr:hypothetical protein [Candidatus Dormibacteraeota bacterium]